ncbi:MAG: hypothetical protein IJS87_01075 [Rhodocyclaceae bacterium]|nr:hypothetical protein [Rhodocyclaceae bacterium]
MLNRLLTAWCLLAGVLIVVLFALTRSYAPPPAQAPQIEALPPLQTPQGAADSGAQAAARPLFWPSRKAQASSAATTAGSLDGAEAIGLAGEGEHAVVLLKQQDKILRLAQGAALGNWVFTGLDAQGAAIFEHNGERRALSVPRPGRELLAPPNH